VFLFTVSLVFNSISFIYKAAKMRGDDQTTRNTKKTLNIVVSIFLVLFLGATVLRCIGECVNEQNHWTFVIATLAVF
jgi:hypothetical protein